jgi:hypothetical protein
MHWVISKKIKLIMSSLLLIVSMLSIANEQGSVATLTQHPWKFFYTFMPINKQIVNELSTENYIYLKFDKDKTFTLISKEKVEKGSWAFDERAGVTTVVFGFKGIDSWMINYLNDQTFVIHCENESGLLEYHFAPATNQKDLNFMADRINEHIDEMKALIDQMSVKQDNTRVENISVPSENKKNPASSNTKSNYITVNVFDKIKMLDANEKELEKVSLNELESQKSKSLEEANTKEDIALLQALNKSKQPKSTTIEKQPVVTEKPILIANTNNISKELANTNNIRSSQREPITLSKKDFVKIFISGGGLKAGINPKLKDIVTIDNSGIVKKDYESLLGGKYTYTKKVNKEDIIKLAEYIVNNGFFEFNEEYNCIEGCESFTTLSGPKPIPLKVIVEVGSERHMVFVPIYAPDLEGYASNYPKELEDIVKAIHDLADI